MNILQDPHNLPMSSTAAQLVQYVVVRGDLLRLLSWPTGAVIAQACHASMAILWMHRNDSNTLQYTSDLDNMHKVILEVSRKQCIHLGKSSQINQTKGICSWVLIDTLDWHLDQYSTDTQSTLDQQLVNSQSNFDWLIWINQNWIDSEPTVYQDLYGVSSKVSINSNWESIEGIDSHLTMNAFRMHGLSNANKYILYIWTAEKDMKTY